MKKGENLILITLFVLGFLLAIEAVYLRFFYAKDFDYLVEALCDPAKEFCFYRDCASNPEDCPPNNLSYYKQYHVKGYDFEKCTDNSCQKQCRETSLNCKEVQCGLAGEDVCVSFKD